MVGLPDGRRVTTTMCGRVTISPHVTLENVLNVLDLSCNLISVSRLMDGCRCLIISLIHYV